VVDGELHAIDDVEDCGIALVVACLDRDEVGLRGQPDVLAVERIARGRFVPLPARMPATWVP
jgi:hypothetical protein